MKQQNKFSSGEEHQSINHQHQSESPAGREFANAEEMLRFDAKHTKVPATVAQRLRRSAGPGPAPGRSWWQRLFGSGS